MPAIFPIKAGQGRFEVERKSLPAYAHSKYASDASESAIAPPSTPKPMCVVKSSAVKRAVQQHIEAVLQRHDQHLKMQFGPGCMPRRWEKFISCHKPKARTYAVAGDVQERSERHFESNDVESG